MRTDISHPLSVSILTCRTVQSYGIRKTLRLRYTNLISVTVHEPLHINTTVWSNNMLHTEHLGYLEHPRTSAYAYELIAVQRATCKKKVVNTSSLRHSLSNCAREEEDTDGRAEERRRQVSVELRPDDARVAVDVGDRAPVLLCLGLLALDRAGDLLADVEFRVLLGGDAVDLEERLGWVELALVAAERGEDRGDVELRLGRHLSERPALASLFKK